MQQSRILSSTDNMSALPPHSGRNVLFFFPDRVGVDSSGAELRMTKPALQHVQRYALNCRVDPKSMPETLWGAVRCIWDARIDHDPLRDLPDPDTAQIPDGCGRFAPRFLSLPDPMGGVQSIEELGWDRHGPEHGFLMSCGVSPFLQGPDRDCATG